MLVHIDESSATLTPFGSLTRHIPANAPTAETKSWSELIELLRRAPWRERCGGSSALGR
jgi:hypothetical protein